MVGPQSLSLSRIESKLPGHQLADTTNLVITYTDKPFIILYFPDSTEPS